MRFYDFAKIQCLHYTGWSRGVDSFLENLLKAKILYTHRCCRETGEERPLVPQAPLSHLQPLLLVYGLFFPLEVLLLFVPTQQLCIIYMSRTHVLQ